MRSTNWKAITEIIGIIAIVVSLIFVGLQLNQSQQIAIAAQYQERAATTIDYYSAQIQSDTAVAVWGQDVLDGIDSLDLSNAQKGWFQVHSISELGLETLDVLVLFTVYDNLFFQYQSEFLTEESGHSFRDRLREQLKRDLVGIIYSNNKHSYHKSVRDLVDDLIEQNNNGA